MDLKQYQIVLVNLDPTVGSEMKKTRPCVVISPNESHTFHYDIGSAVVLESNKTYQIVKVVSAGQTNHSVFASFEIK